MKLLSALLDVALLPLSIAGDLIMPPFVRGNGYAEDPDSFTRRHIEKIEEELTND